MSLFVCYTVHVCLAVSPADFLTLPYTLFLQIHPQTHRMLQRSTVLLSVRCFKSSMDTRPLSVWTGQGITTPCLTVIGYREVSDRNIAHSVNLCESVRLKIMHVIYVMYALGSIACVCCVCRSVLLKPIWWEHGEFLGNELSDTL